MPYSHYTAFLCIQLDIRHCMCHQLDCNSCYSNNVLNKSSCTQCRISLLYSLGFNRLIKFKDLCSLFSNKKNKVSKSNTFPDSQCMNILTHVCCTTCWYIPVYTQVHSVHSVCYRESRSDSCRYNCADSCYHTYHLHNLKR